MFFFKKRKDDELRSPSGLGAVLHKTVMFVTYPFRKPVYLALMLVLVLAARCGRAALLRGRTAGSAYLVPG